MGCEEVMVVTGPGQGHINPCLELCNLLALRNYQTTLVIPTSLSSSSSSLPIPSSFTQNPLTRILTISSGSGPTQAAQDLSAHISSHRTLFGVVDFQMGWTKAVFRGFDVTVVALFTFGACAAAMEWGAWKARVGDLRPGEARPVITGLPEEMAFGYSDLKRRPSGQKRAGGPPNPGDRPPWVSEVEGSIGSMFNTCHDLERPFLDYLNAELGMPAWGVGPLSPERWPLSPERCLVPRQSCVSEDDVIRWLDRKPRGTVLYVAFGSEVGPTEEECLHLGRALEELTHPFVWVTRSGSGHELSERARERGLMIHGWAPQLSILGHASTGGFLSHCGWNSTVEALGCGVPILAWPIRGDQYYNAKFVANYLKLGYKISEDSSEMVKKEDIWEGVEKLMGDEEMKQRAMELCRKFKHEFPAKLGKALDAFEDFFKRKHLEN